MMTLSSTSQQIYMNFCGDNMMASSVGHLVGQGATAMAARPEEGSLPVARRVELPQGVPAWLA